MIPPHWYDAGSYLSEMINIMSADSLAPCVARTSATMILTMLNQHNSARTLKVIICFSPDRHFMWPCGNTVRISKPDHQRPASTGRYTALSDRVTERRRFPVWWFGGPWVLGPDCSSLRVRVATHQHQHKKPTFCRRHIRTRIND